MTCTVSDKVKFILYADDQMFLLKVLIDLDDTHCVMNDVLNKIAEWFCANQLSLNIKKTQYMIFSNGNHNFSGNITIGEEVVKWVSSVKFLGINIDEKLLWKEQIYSVHAKLSKSVGILYKVKHLFTRNWLLKLYNAFVLPHITYCNVIWCSTHQSYLNDVIFNQKRALKLALNVPSNTPSNVIFQNHKHWNFVIIISCILVYLCTNCILICYLLRMNFNVLLIIRYIVMILEAHKNTIYLN